MSNETTIMPGAEAYSAQGDRRGALIIHGFTGCPQSMRPLAEAFAAAGFSVELPRLPGHGTTSEDMAKYQWRDWTAAVDAAYRNLGSRTDKIIVAGLSMGGTLTLWTAEQHPEVAAIVVINGACEDEDLKGLVEAAVQALASSQTFLQGVAGDVADPNSKELGYDRVPAAHGQATHGRCGGSKVETWRNQMSGADPAQSARPCCRPWFGQGHARRNQSADRICSPRKQLSRGNDRF